MAENTKNAAYYTFTFDKNNPYWCENDPFLFNVIYLRSIVTYVNYLLASGERLYLMMGDVIKMFGFDPPEEAYEYCYVRGDKSYIDISILNFRTMEEDKKIVVGFDVGDCKLYSEIKGRA